MLKRPEIWKDLRFTAFPKFDRRFAEFVIANRVDNVFNECPHGYDIIYGVMSDNRPDLVIAELDDGTITRERAVERIMKSNSMKQLYLGTQRICDIPKIKEIYYGGEIK